ncbi:TIGR02281 family clan AA aspartic protease [Agrobacterium rubi]|uniref:TIGR02281 family clan AA aspartic protease n=1 Tax=Agrobacterium rubi TaxID=28099 RepID=UPI0015717DCA|nr:TIGR02281 family clan AA aspartic protease [Agrobacterium rubi]NTF07630.1 TIGR02281 family clan AA aspartic protease [Agrobacterium rubi]NTF19754.1 TIGR02281 family clan AA aspartic protease [Agrobacterium rubi]NTF26719.1 TIGR02281 family clan AA aspartic protease [Agrobacterium rubi]
MNRLTFVFLILGVGLALLIFNHDSGRTFGVANDDFAHALYLAPIAALLSVGILAGNRGGFGTALRQMAIWLVIILSLVAVYLYRYDFQRVGDRLLAGLIPGRAVVVTTQGGEQDVIINKSMNGHFETDAQVNGAGIHMLVDTGASSVVLSNEDAAAVGINVENLDYSVSVMTANGRTSAAPVRLRELAIGPIVRRNVEGLVAQSGQLDQSLLGMTFLSTLGSLQMQTDELRLRDQ